MGASRFYLACYQEHCSEYCEDGDRLRATVGLRRSPRDGPLLLLDPHLTEKKGTGYLEVGKGHLCKINDRKKREKGVVVI